jgi:hypothetical protein
LIEERFLASLGRTVQSGEGLMGSEDGVGSGAEAELGGGQGQEEFCVLGRTPDRDTDRFGETHPAHGTDDYALVKEFVAKSFGVGPNGDEEEIAFARNGRKAEIAEFVEEALALVAIGLDGADDVIVVVEGGEGGGLADTGDVERRAEFIHFGD